MATKAPGAYSSEISVGSSINSRNKNVTIILGKATSGPLEPTEVFSKTHAMKLFGPELSNDFGLIGLNKIIPNAESVFYCRICHMGDKATFKSTSKAIFEAKDGGTHLNNATVTCTLESDLITVKIVKDSITIEEVVASNNKLSSDYIFDVFNKKSGYLDIVADSQTDFSSLTDIVTTPGTEGAKSATGKSGSTGTEDLVVKSKYFGTYLNQAKFLISVSVEGRVSAKLTKGNVLIEEIPSISKVESTSEFITRFNLTSEYLSIVTYPAIKSIVVTLDGGDDGLLTTDSDYIGSSDMGLKSIEDASQYLITTLIIPGISSPKVLAYAQTLVSTRQDSLFIADPPLGLKAYQTVQWVDALNAFAGSTRLDSSWTAVYSPWVQLSNDSGDTIFMPPSIPMASLICKNDQTYYTWNSPAGKKRGVLEGVSGLEYKPSIDDRNIMYTNSVINPIIFIKDVGYVAFGNKTCRRAKSPLNPEPACSLNVRRMVNYVKFIVNTISMDFVFDINDSFTWDEFKLKVDPKLREIKDNRGLYEYDIIMDATTVTPDKIDALEMPGVIRLKPTRESEVIDIGFELNPSGVVFTTNEI